MTDLRPAGTGEFGEERVDVVTESEWIEHGSRIRIVSSQGYRHVVRLVAPPARGGNTGEVPSEAASASEATSEATSDES
jgi:hypothetical protein